MPLIVRRPAPPLESEPAVPPMPPIDLADDKSDDESEQETA